MRHRFLKPLALPAALLLLQACNHTLTEPVPAVPGTLNWTIHNSGAVKNLYSVVSSGTQFVTVGSDVTLRTSPDLVSWTPQIATLKNNQILSLLSIAWTGRLFVATGVLGAVVTSPDGVTWTTQDFKMGNNPLSTMFSVIWTGSSSPQAGSGTGQLVTVGSFGTVLTSSDGVTWFEPVQVTNYHLRSVAWSGSTGSPQAGRQFVAVGDGTILTSPDAVTWTEQYSGLKETDTLRSVAWMPAGISTGAGRFVAVGGNGGNSAPVLTGPNAIILTSPDGVAWTRQDPNLRSNPTSDLLSVVWTGPSTDSAGSPQAGSGTGQVVAVGENGTVLNSLDGVNWFPQNPPTRHNLNSVVWTAGRLIAVGDSGTVLTSP